VEPRDYQVKAVEDCRQAYRDGARSVLLVVPTGGGKTVIGSLVVAGAIAKGRRVLWLAGRRELVDQAASRMPVAAGVVMAGRALDIDAPIQVASIDTLAARGSIPPADLVVIDEAHHATAATWRAVIDAQPEAMILGLTATPVRSDGAALGDVFDALVLGPTIRRLIDDGHLVPTHVLGPETPGRALAMDPAAAWLRYGQGKPGFAFHRLVSESQAFVAQLVDRGIGAAHVDGNTPPKMREAAVAAFREGSIECLSSVGVFTEGVDVPRAEVCLLARGCDHAGLYLQMVGRVMRPYRGKHAATVVDLRGCFHRLGLPDVEREWSLSGVQGQPKGQATLRQCPECGCVYEPGGKAECPRCGYIEKIEPQAIVEREIKAARGPLKPNASVETIRSYRKMLEKTARERRYRSGWVHHRMVAVFGHEAITRAGLGFGA